MLRVGANGRSASEIRIRMLCLPHFFMSKDSIHGVES